MEKRRVIALQNVDEQLWDKVQAFLQQHKRIPSISALGKVAIEQYIDLASKHGIDHDWKVKVGHEAS
jgi:hypothetical protein